MKSLSDTPGAPEQSFQWLRPFLPRMAQPTLRGLRKRWQRRSLRLEEPFRTVFPYTQVSAARQKNIIRLAGEIEAARLTGAVVECGVLDGGTAALLAFATASSDREVHLFDAWQGLPLTTPEDGVDARKWTGQVVGSTARVGKVMHALCIDPSRVHFHRGWFNETFPTVEIERVAMLHIDCDFFEPTQLCLERWYPRLVPGGFVQIDDYSSFEGCRTAVDKFLRSHPELSLETWGDHGEAYFISRPQVP